MHVYAHAHTCIKGCCMVKWPVFCSMFETMYVFHDTLLAKLM